MTSSSKPGILLVPSPGMGHLIPFLELAKVLVTSHNFHATVIVVSSNSIPSPSKSQVIHSAMSAKQFDIIELPPLDAPFTGAAFTELSAMMIDVRSSLWSVISAMEHKPAAIIVDIFGIGLLTVAAEFNMLKYVRASSGLPIALKLYAPTLDKQVEGEYLDQKEPLKIPGCMSVRPEDILPAMINRKDPEYDSFLRVGSEIALMSDGILVQTWEDLEPKTLSAMREHPEWKKIVKVPVYTFGPIIRPAGQSGQRSDILGWLDLQPKESVIYVSFGTIGCLSADQITEMAWGLELSSQRFIWVARPPIDGKGSIEGLLLLLGLLSQLLSSFSSPCLMMT